MQRDTAYWTSAILNAAWHVRAARRDAERAQAVQLMGETVREAFASCDDYRPLLRAVAEGLTNVPDGRWSV